MFNEMKKFYKTTPILICFILAVFLSIAAPILFINQYSICDYSTGEEVIVSGLEGIRFEKEQVGKISGSLTIDKLNEAFDYYKKQPGGNKASFNMENKYPKINSLLSDAYTPYGEKTLDLRKISNTDDFYTRNIERVKEKMDLTSVSSISQDEREEVEEKAADISEPYNFEFADQWTILIKSLLFVYIVIILSGILISSRLFSFEKENNMDIILNSAGRKKLVGIGVKKNFSLIFYLSVEFVLCTGITSAIVFGFTGTTGWNSQIQILPQFFTIIYNWTIGEMFIKYLLIAWICILAVSLIGSLINSILQETYTSLIVTVLLMVLPIFLRSSSLLALGIQKCLYVQPINGISLLHFIDNLFIYRVGNMKLLSASVIIVVGIVYFVVGFIVSPIMFSKRISKRTLFNN